MSASSAGDVEDMLAKALLRLDANIKTPGQLPGSCVHMLLKLLSSMRKEAAKEGEIPAKSLLASPRAKELIIHAMQCFGRLCQVNPMYKALK